MLTGNYLRGSKIDFRLGTFFWDPNPECTHPGGYFSFRYPYPINYPLWVIKFRYPLPTRVPRLCTHTRTRGTYSVFYAIIDKISKLWQKYDLKIAGKWAKLCQKSKHRPKLTKIEWLWSTKLWFWAFFEAWMSLFGYLGTSSLHPYPNPYPYPLLASKKFVPTTHPPIFFLKILYP